MADIDPADVHQENGRSYVAWHRGEYWLPQDDTEHERLDILHGLFYNSDKLNMPLHLNRLDALPGRPLRILDIGCGTGFWALEMAESYENAEIIGTDLIGVQPTTISPRNLSFRVKWDFNDPEWGLGENSFDLIHMSMITACAVDWPLLYSRVYNHLKPGTGYIEHLDLDLRPYTDDSLGPESYIHQWYNNLVRFSNQASRPIAYEPLQTHKDLINAGFANITHDMKMIPWHFYADGDQNFSVGGTWQVCMVQGRHNGLETYSMAPFTRVEGWPAVNVQRMCRNIEMETNARGKRVYSYVHYWTGQKPAIPRSQADIDRDLYAVEMSARQRPMRDYNPTPRPDEDDDDSDEPRYGR